MLRHPATGAVAVKLIYFGGRFISVLAVAHLLGGEASIYLFAVALSEAMRLIFDFGLESHVIARLHRKSHAALHRYRLISMVIGQVICALIALLLAIHRQQSVSIAFIGSLHFTLLMAFGYLQAWLQADQSLSRLIKPMILAAFAQLLLLAAAFQQVIAAIWCGLSFELLSVLLCAHAGGAVFRSLLKPDAKHDETIRSTYRQLRPLGHAAVLSFLYGRLDIWVVSAVSSSTLITQYLATQRLASAPLMLLATIAGAMVPSLVAETHELKKVVQRSRFLMTGGLGAFATLVFVAIAGAYATPWLVGDVAYQPHINLIALQACIAAIQVANSFYSAALLADGQADRLFTIAWRGALTSIFSFALAIWIKSPEAIASAVLATEIVITSQHFLYRQKLNH